LSNVDVVNATSLHLQASASTDAIRWTLCLIHDSMDDALKEVIADII
jgi:hypothetical protein